MRIGLCEGCIRASQKTPMNLQVTFSGVSICDGCYYRNPNYYHYSGIPDINTTYDLKYSYCEHNPYFDAGYCYWHKIGIGGSWGRRYKCSDDECSEDCTYKLVYYFVINIRMEYLCTAPWYEIRTTVYFLDSIGAALGSQTWQTNDIDNKCIETVCDNVIVPSCAYNVPYIGGQATIIEL